MKLQFIPIVTDEQIDTLAFMADTVWHEWFSSIISAEQIDYMLKKFQSFASIKNQIQNQEYEYYFLNAGGTNVGYIGIHPDEENKKLFLSKIYILQSFRGNRYASEAFEFLEGICQGMGFEAIWLTVNKHNDNALHVYSKRGFENIRSEVTDIGSGFVMDDYIMEKKIS